MTEDGLVTENSVPVELHAALGLMANDLSGGGEGKSDGLVSDRACMVSLGVVVVGVVAIIVGCPFGWTGVAAFACAGGFALAGLSTLSMVVTCAHSDF